jgi:NADH dehydrogenase (ubiquinone) 1 alpha subcomplex subunit 5
MRSTFRLLAAVKPARYLEPGHRTGLTGIFTHNSPRSTLLAVYNSTLEKLKAVPESSLYRQSVEAVTKHRMALVEGMVPPGYKEWKAKATKTMAEVPDDFRIRSGLPTGSPARKIKVGNHTVIVTEIHEVEDPRDEPSYEDDMEKFEVVDGKPSVPLTAEQ